MHAAGEPAHGGGTSRDRVALGEADQVGLVDRDHRDRPAARGERRLEAEPGG